MMRCVAFLCFLMAPYLMAEDLLVFRCKSSLHTISPYAIDSRIEDDVDSINLTIFSKLEELGKIQCDGRFAKIFNEAIAHDSSSDPFFRGGQELIIENEKGELFIIYIEYVKDLAPNKVIDRFGVGKLIDLGEKKEGKILTGSRKDGTSFDSKIAKQLRKIATAIDE